MSQSKEVNFLPQHQPYTLPSRGKLYTGSSIAKDGVVHVRPMTLREERILTTPTFIKNGTAIDTIVKECLKEQIKIENVLSQDKMGILLFLRAVSYGTDYPIEVRCPSCDHVNSHVVNLETDLITKYLDDSVKEPIDCFLPISKKNVRYRLHRVRDERSIDSKVKLIENQKIHGPNETVDGVLLNPTSMVQLKELIVDIEGIDPSVKDLFIENLIAGDASILRTEINEFRFGIDTSLKFNCQKCAHEWTAGMDVNENFFRSTRPAPGNERGGKPTGISNSGQSVSSEHAEPPQKAA